LNAGPGSYAEFKSEFEKNYDLKTAREKNTFFCKDNNGHIQRKVQPFALRGQKDVKERPMVEVPGPG